MSLQALLLSSDDKTVRVVRRILSDFEISVDHCSSAEHAVRKLTRRRFEAVIVDSASRDAAESVLKSAKASPSNNRALAVVLVDSSLGLRGGFDLGGHFVLHKPLHPERARASFRAVRALMKQERRRQTRIPVEIPVECFSEKTSRKFKVHTIDLCEGGMAIRSSIRLINEGPTLFKLYLPGTNQKLEAEGEFAWEGNQEHSGVRFTSVSDQDKFLLRHWIHSRLPEPADDDPPVACHLADISLGACYLETESPFPVHAGLSLVFSARDMEIHTMAVVRVMHPDVGMGLEFLQRSQAERDQVRKLIELLRETGNRAPEVLVSPESLDITLRETPEHEDFAGDSLLELLWTRADLPAETFMAELRQQREISEVRS